MSILARLAEHLDTPLPSAREALALLVFAIAAWLVMAGLA